MTQQIIQEYDAKHGIHEDFCGQVESLLRQLLKAKQIPAHSISSRVKARDSLIAKIDKKGRNYRDLSDVTDLIGIRVITYFADQVDDVSKLIESEFEVDPDNSVDKRDSLDPDRFGYLSMHYIVSLPKQRKDLTENKIYANLKAEIQIRSILQHAWAEIEHDLGYKSKREVPFIIRRQFARLSGLLELGDEEFVKIRNDLHKYEASMPGEIASNTPSTPIDKVTLLEFAKHDKTIEHLDKSIAKALKCKLVGEAPDIEGDIDRLGYFGLTKINQLKEALEKYQVGIVKLAEIWGSDPDDEIQNDPTIRRGISLFYLTHLLAGAKQSQHEIDSYYKKFQIGSPFGGEDQSHDLLISLARKLSLPN